MEAKNTLIEHNLRLVSHIIKKYYTSNGDQDDLISIGTMGLIKAVNSFNLDKNTRFATYAARCVENEIFMHFRSLKRLNCEVSLSDPIDTDKDGNTLDLMDIISFDDESMLDNIDRKDLTSLLLKYIDSKLDKRERLIILARYGLKDTVPHTQREIAQSCGISRSYVSRIEKRALKKLEQAFTESGFNNI